MSTFLCPLCSSLHTTLFTQQRSYRFFLCHYCKTLFLSPTPSTEDTTKYYEHSFQYELSPEQKTEIRLRSQHILHKLKQYNPKGRSLLDIGAGTGILLEEAGELALSAEGVEPSNELYATLIQKELKVVHSTLAAFETDKKYDFITLVHVLEHVSNPELLLKKAFAMLQTGGILYIETPNLDSHLFYAEKEEYTFLTPPEHLWIFSRDSLKYLLPGHEPRLVQTYTPVEHAVGMIRRLLGRSPIHAHSTNLTQPSPTGKGSLKYRLFHHLLIPPLGGLFNVAYKGSILAMYYAKR